MPFSEVAASPIRVLLVDDSPVALALLKRMLQTSPSIEVVGTARSGREALALLPQVRPGVICTDLHMPGMDGLDFIREVMAISPCPILVISSTFNSDPQAPRESERAKAFALLEAGAVDVFPKPTGLEGFEEAARQLVQKVRILAGVFVFARRGRAPGSDSVPDVLVPHALVPHALVSQNMVSQVQGSASVPDARQALLFPRALKAPRTMFQLHKAAPVRLVAIGSSTGGPQVLHSILSRLPANYPVPVLCVQHISKGFLSGLIDWLDGQCRVRVRVAQHGEEAQPGTVYFPAEGNHLEIDIRARLRLSDAPHVDGHRPSVTALFNAVARSYGNESLAVLLTGMGGDGASGMNAVHRAGGVTIAQDEASCVVFGMPKQAIEMGAAQFALPPEEIAQALLHIVARS